MKKIIRVAAVLTSLTLFACMLTACGEKKEAETTTAAETTVAETTEAAAEETTEAAVEETTEAAAEETTEAAAEEATEAAAEEGTAGEAQEVTINLMGTDTPVTLTISGDTFEATYSFNGNDVVAKGTVGEDGALTVTESTPSTVPAQYVQGAMDLVADELK